MEKDIAPLIPPEHAYHSLEVMLAAQAAGRDGRAREISSDFPGIGPRAPRRRSRARARARSKERDVSVGATRTPARVHDPRSAT